MLLSSTITFDSILSYLIEHGEKSQMHDSSAAVNAFHFLDFLWITLGNFIVIFLRDALTKRGCFTGENLEE